MVALAKEARIAIIGAGPSGLGMAEALQDRGYTNVTVFEKSDRVGGMALSRTYQPKDPTLPPLSYDLGSVQPAGSNRLFQLIKKHGLHLGKDVILKKPCKYRIYSFKDRAYHADFLTYRTGFPIAKLPLLLIDTMKLLPWIIKYRSLYQPGFAHVDNLDLIAEPYAQWIKKRNFFLLGKFFEEMCSISTHFGLYAGSSDASFLYTLKVLICDLHTKPMTYGGGNFIPVREGYQEIWKRVAKSHKVIFNANITNIERGNNTVTLYFGNGQAQEFDYLVVACFLPGLKEVLDITQDEDRIFSQIKAGSGWRIAFTAKNMPHDAGYIFVDQMIEPNIPPTITLVNSEGYIGDDTYLYSGMIGYPKPEGLEQVLERSKKLLEDHFKATDLQWIDQAYWPEYNSHFSPQSIKNGIFKQFEAIQGQNRTYYVGEILSGQANGICMDYSYDLAKRFF